VNEIQSRIGWKNETGNDLQKGGNQSSGKHGTSQGGGTPG